MKLKFDGYQLVTDSRQFIIQKEKVVQESQFTKEENVGDIYYENIAYYGQLDLALKYLSKLVILENDDLKVIKAKLSQLEAKISEFIRILEEE